MEYFYENKQIIAKQPRMLLIMWLKQITPLWNIKVFYKMIMITTSIITAFGKEY